MAGVEETGGFACSSKAYFGSLGLGLVAGGIAGYWGGQSLGSRVGGEKTEIALGVSAAAIGAIASPLLTSNLHRAYCEPPVDDFNRLLQGLSNNNAPGQKNLKKTPVYFPPDASFPQGFEINLGYYEFGEKYKPQKTLVVFHGFSSHSFHMFPMVQGLADQLQARIIIVDLPGIGNSDGFPDAQTNRNSYDFESRVVPALLKFLKAIAAKNIILSGHSMGAFLAEIVASQSIGTSKEIKGLLLFAPPEHPSDTAPPGAPLALWALVQSQECFAPPIERSLHFLSFTTGLKRLDIFPADFFDQSAEPYTHATTCLARSRYADIIYRMGTEKGWEGSTNQIHARLKNLNIPKQVVFYTQDRIITRERSQKICHDIGATCLEVNSYHQSPVSLATMDRKKTRDIILNFFQRF